MLGLAKNWIIPLIFFIIVVSTSTRSAMVQTAVEDSLSDRPTARVIILLDDTGLAGMPRGIVGGQGIQQSAAIASVDSRKADIASSQNGFLYRYTKDEIKSRQRFALINGISAEISQAGLEKLRHDPLVKGVYLDNKVQAFLNDSVPVVGASYLWNVSFSGAPVTGISQVICVIDTGIDYNHASISSRYNGGINYCANEDCTVNSTDPMDNNGHGTHVAGIIASVDPVYKGVAPGSHIVAVKALNSSGAGWDSNIVAGIDWCVTNATQYKISVISMSIGSLESYNVTCDSLFPYYSAAINSAYNAGISVVVSSGNNGYSYNLTSPGCIDNATSVGSTTKDDQVSGFSNTAFFLDLLAPGSSIKSLKASGTSIGSCSDDDIYRTCSGTSMAAPHVAGAIALLRDFKSQENGTTLGPAAVLDVLRRTGVNVTDPVSLLGFSRINLSAALEYIDALPTITFQEHPENNSFSGATAVNISISSSEPLSNVTIEFFGQNYTMNETPGSDSKAFTFNATDLQEGAYNYTIYYNDSTDNWGSTGTFFFTIDRYNPWWENNITYPLSGENYSASQVCQFNVSWNDSNLQQVWIEHNFNGTYVNHSTTGNNSNLVFFYDKTLSPGAYQWRMIANDTAGKMNLTPYFSYVVVRSEPWINLSLNETISNLSINETSYVNITCIKAVGEGNILLFINGQMYANESALISNNTPFNAPGDYNITLLYPLTQNYSSSYATLWIEVNETTPPNITFQSPSNNTFYPVSTVIINFTTDDNATCTYSLNGTDYLSFSPPTAYIHTLSLSSLENNVYNLTVNCTNLIGLETVSALNFTVDTALPGIQIISPLANESLPDTSFDVAYSINDTYMNNAWYYIDNHGRIGLTPGNDLTQPDSVIYPGLHTLRMYANDSAGNLNNRNISFYVDTTFNLTDWIADVLGYNSNITGIAVKNSSRDEVFYNVSVIQNFTMEINMSGVQVQIVNFSGLSSSWENWISAYSNYTYFDNLVIAAYNTRPVHYAYLPGFSDFNNNPGAYYGIVKLPFNRSLYDAVYYCNTTSPMSCTEVTSICSSYGPATLLPCLNQSAEGTIVYVPHFSAVFGSFDDLSPQITFSAPINGSVINQSYLIKLNVTTNENANCRYKSNVTLFDISTYNSSYVNFTADEGQGTGSHLHSFGEVWKNGQYNITVECNDLSSRRNNATATIFFRVNDTISPVLPAPHTISSTTEMTFEWSTNEPTNCTLTLGSETPVTCTDFSASDRSKSFSGLDVNTDYSYSLVVYDRNGKSATRSGSVSTDAESSDDGNNNNGNNGGGGGGGGGGGTRAGPSKVTTIWDSLPVGQHTMFVSSSSIAVVKIVFNTTVEKNSSVQMSVENLTELPKDIPWLKDKGYQYLRITVANLNPSEISSVQIDFKIANSWITANNINRNTIKIYRYTSKWEELSTTSEGLDSSSVHYSAQSPGFSYFGIRGDSLPDEGGTGSGSNTTVQQPNGGNEPVTGEIIRNVGGNTSTGNNSTGNIGPIRLTPANFIGPVVVLMLIVILISFLVYQNKYSVVTDQDLVELRVYIQKCESEGVMFEEIKRNLMNVGWKESIVDLVLHEVHLPHKNLEKLVRYIQYSQKKGTSKAQIRENLMKRGWQKEVINNAFEYVE